MLKIKRKSLLSQLNVPSNNGPEMEKKSNIVKWVEEQMDSFQFNLSDENCDFYVNNIVREHNKLVIVEMYIKPKRGIFVEIQFRPKMYFSCIDLVKRPKLYNDRRIFHPNINIETLEIFFPQLVLDWNPTKKLQALLKSLKYILIEPNIAFVPNTELNKKAGMWYHFRRGQYRQIIFENMPLSFENLFGKEDNTKKESMELQSENQGSEKKKQNEWYDVRSLYPAKIRGPKFKTSPNDNQIANPKRSINDTTWKDEEQIKILAKQMKRVHLFSDTQNEQTMDNE